MTVWQRGSYQKGAQEPKFKYGRYGYRSVEKVDPNINPTQLGPAWERWHRSFELYAIGKGITDVEQKRALLLHLAGLHIRAGRNRYR